MDRTAPEPHPTPQMATPAFDSFAELLAAAPVTQHAGSTVIDLGGGSTLRLENARIAQLAALLRAA